MDHLTSLGLILLFALLAGHLVRAVRVPEVTGYILAGIALGPSVLGWLSHDNLITMGVFSEVALGLILFSVGSVFEVGRFRKIGRQVILLTLAESACAAAIVGIGMLVLGQHWQVALLLGAIAIATAPASTLMVLREADSAGPLTDALMGIIAVNNLLCLTTFSLVAALIDLFAPGESTSLATRQKLTGQAIAAVSLGRRLRSRGVRHIHCHFASAPTTIGMYAAIQLGIPFSFTGHANDLFQRRHLLPIKIKVRKRL